MVSWWFSVCCIAKAVCWDCLLREGRFREQMSEIKCILSSLFHNSFTMRKPKCNSSSPRCCCRTKYREDYLKACKSWTHFLPLSSLTRRASHLGGGGTYVARKEAAVNSPREWTPSQTLPRLSQRRRRGMTELQWTQLRGAQHQLEVLEVHWMNYRSIPFGFEIIATTIAMIL